MSFINTNFVTLSSSNFTNDGQKYIAMGNDGLPRMVYVDGTSLYFVRFLNSKGTSIVSTAVVTGLTNGADNPNLRIGTDGFPRIAYGDNGHPTLHVKLFIGNDIDGTTGTVISIDTATYGEGDLFLVLDSNNKCFVVYKNTATNSIKLARTDADGSNLVITTPITSGVTNTSNIPVQIGSDGFIRFAYIKGPSPWKLHFVQALDLGATTNIDTIVDSNIDRSIYIDLALAPDDTPRLVNSASYLLKYIIGLNQSGSSVLVKTLVTENDAGFIQELSLTLSSDNTAKISYGFRDTINLDFRIMFVDVDRYGLLISNTRIDDGDVGSFSSVYNSLILDEKGSIFVLWSRSDERTLVMAVGSASNFSLHTIQLVGADTDGDIQTMNAGKNDNGDPINFELETQQLEFGNRSHLKKIADRIVVFSKDADASTLLVNTDKQDYIQVPISLEDRVNIGKDINLEGHYAQFKWYGESDSQTPIFEGLYLDKITDEGMI